MNDRYPTVSRGPSPAPLSPSVPGHTPSPLRDAMEDVMCSLNDMAIRQEPPSPTLDRQREPLDPWSPDAFEGLQSRSGNHRQNRPLASFGVSSTEEDNRNDIGYNAPHPDGQFAKEDTPPHLSNYVERMEERLAGARTHDELFLGDDEMGPPPIPPPKNSGYNARPSSSQGVGDSLPNRRGSSRRLRNRKSAYELGRDMLGRTFTTKSSATNSSDGVQSVSTNGTSSTQRTSQSIMSGYSAGGFSSTSAGSLARKRGLGSIRRPKSIVDIRQDALLHLSAVESKSQPQTPSVAGSAHSSHRARPTSTVPSSWSGAMVENEGLLGGLTTPKAKKSSFFRKLVDTAKTGAASARSSIAVGQSEKPPSPIKSLLPNGVTAISGGSAARDMGLGGDKGTFDWVQIRRDVNRSNSLSRNEKAERAERCELMGYPALSPVDELERAAQGDEDMEGRPIFQPTDFNLVNFQLVDKSARFVNSLPPMTNPASLAQGYVCRPYRSDTQKLRAIFTWVSEKVAWEEDFEGDVDTRHVIQTRRGSAQEVAVLVMEMCSAVGLHAEVVRGYLKAPGEILEPDGIPRPNHWWNAVIADGDWRVIDCSLASPTNPQREQYSSAGSQVAESGFFLARPMEVCYTHIPMHHQQQHICPPVAPQLLLALPCACPPYFKHGLRMMDFDTSLCRIENLELVHIQFAVPPDIECVAEVVTRAYAHDTDGDVFENGDTRITRALAQAEWLNGQKRFTVKALLPGDEGQGILKVYAGKRGLMHSVKDNPHPLAFALPIIHTGTNPPYEFFTRHPTPHAVRHDLYVAQPQCARLAVNNTFVFAVRQHPSSLSCTSPPASASSGSGLASPTPFARPGSALSMISTATSAASGSDYFSQASSSSSQQGQPNQKPAKLAIQAPSGKILRLMRKGDSSVSIGEWETIIKVSERGTWRGLVLADRSARWCVWGEWECV